MTTFRYRGTFFTAAIVGIVLSAAWLAYQPALSGTFLLDDVANLGGLQSIDDTASALHFVLSGSAGPVGRPLALASFLPQAEQWEQGAAPFLAVNIAIHLLNGCLLGSFLYLLTRARGIGRAESRYVALTAMALWLFMPLLASSTLMVVQRMTTLSATFVLLGLNLYLWARARIDDKSGAALAGMSVALVGSTLLAVLTKESGALLPVLVLVVEATLLDPPASVPKIKWRAWGALFLLLPTMLILAYVVTRVPYSEGLILRRDFSGTERVMTETQVLWQYLFNGFLPQPGRYGPFHDDYPVARTLDPVTFSATAGWVLAIVLALVFRRKSKLFAFAVLWFVGGHLLESTTIALELYFEHRNYVPMIGPVYALCSLAVSVPNRYRNIVRAALPLYVLVNAFVLVGLTSLWGDPALATRVWHDRFPESTRALTAMTTRQLETGVPGAAMRSLQRFIDRNPEHAYFGIPVLNLSCIIAPAEDHRKAVKSLMELLPRVQFSYTTGTMLSELVSTAVRVDCRGIDLDLVQGLALTLLDNPRYVFDPAYRQLHHQLMAQIARHSGDTQGTLDHLYEAMKYKKESRLNMMVVTTLVSAKRFDEARGFIDSARHDTPIHPLKRWLWQSELAQLATYVEKSEEVGVTSDG